MDLGIRPSQYITTFGPGAIIETPLGPYILSGTSEVIQRISDNGIDINDLEIREPLLENGLLGGARIFRLPDENISERFSHPVKKFPTWNHCETHKRIYRNDTGCSLCTGKNRDASKTAKFASRFLVACRFGHLDDVPWDMLVHSGQGRSENAPRCNPPYFEWLGSGATLKSITIRCPACGANRPLNQIYSSKFKCRGRRPEISAGKWDDCENEEAEVVQRGSFTLRLPEIVTSLSIPPFTSGLHRILMRPDIQSVIDIIEAIGLTEENFRGAVENIQKKKKIPFHVGEFLLKTKWREIERALEDFNNASKQVTKKQFLEREHRALLMATENGFPPRISTDKQKPWNSEWFEVDQNFIRHEVSGPFKKLKFRVVPVDVLRVVLVQNGFRRVEYSGPNSKLTSAKARDLENPDKFWVPGVSQLGEGIYIDLNPLIKDQLGWVPTGASAQEWLNGDYFQNSEDSIDWNPLSIWWHSLSHRLINALALHSGYSSNSIRERLYLSKSPEGKMQGGVLLYTTQPGGDGTLGGLTSLVPDFEEILELALETVDSCSNDPLCEKSEIDPISHVGAVCYSCQIVSETSCEHFNSYLDRRILLENLP